MVRVKVDFDRDTRFTARYGNDRWIFVDTVDLEVSLMLTESSARDLHAVLSELLGGVE